MKTITLIFLSLIVSLAGHAQVLNGVVIDGETLKPLQNVIVVNQATYQSTTTDKDGHFLLLAKTGDVIATSFTGYHAIHRPANPGQELRLELYPLTVKLKEYVVRDLTPFQRDSIELTVLYSKELNKRPVKPGFSSANGGGFSGLIGAPIQRLSKSYRQNKRFRETFKKDMEQRYIDTRYTPTLVGTLTGLTGDNLAMFMNTFPMEYGFARRATDLELKIWIRDNYKKYTK